MSLPSKLWRSMRSLLPISEAEPRSVDRSRGLSWFVVPNTGHEGFWTRGEDPFSKRSPTAFAIS